MKHLLGVVVVLVTSRPASAEDTAEQLFRRGRALLAAGNLAAACDAFAHSDQLEPRVGTLLNLANCRERQGRIADARASFCEAHGRAMLTLEPRAGFAAERCAALERELSVLTLEVTADRAADGLVIKRAGVVVPPRLWNTPVPLDPGEYTIEATAPARAPWTVTRLLRPGEHITITIDPLAAELPTSVARATPATAELPATALSPAHRHLAVGAALGIAAGKLSSAPDASPDVLEDDHVPVGLRVLGSMAVPHGAVRGVGTVLYTKGLNDKTDPTNTKQLYVLGLGADYVYMPRPQLAIAAGLGIGWDYEVRAGQGSDLARWEAVRASPIVFRLADGAVELGLHAQLVRRGDGLGFIGVAAIDVFLL